MDFHHLPFSASLAQYEYRVATICPYLIGDMRVCMATWKRDGRQSVYTLRSTAEELKQLQADFEAKKFMWKLAVKAISKAGLTT